MSSKTPLPAATPLLWKLIGILFLGLVLLVNPFTVHFLEAKGLWFTPEAHLMHSNDIYWFLPFGLDLMALAQAIPLLIRPYPLAHWFRNSLLYNVVLLFGWTIFYLSSNTIATGAFLPIRILLILVLIVLLSQTLNLAVIRERSRPLRAVVKNLALSAYGMLLTLALLEIVFLFVWSSHRYNGTLSSRSWFYQYWNLNSEGYRDPEYNPQSFQGKSKVMVLGDSFTAGHGVKDEADRFSDRLAAAFPDRHQVFNLGVNGADVRMSYDNLKAFPYSPDILIFSYYPNDIERDGELGGLTLARFKTYADIPLPLRFWVRRTYLWNYLYWRFPHHAETFDYKAYLDECYQNEAVMRVHGGHLNQLVEFAAQNGAKMAVIVWPLLENVSMSKAWTAQISQHFRAQGIPALDVGSFTEGRDPMEMVVNISDAHPSVAMHHEVGDSLIALFRRMNW